MIKIEKKNIRQGDVFLLRIGQLPKDLRQKDNILARGEVTGHKHQIIGAAVLTDGSTQYVDVENEAELVHEEHAAHKLQKGVYRVIIQREINLTALVQHQVSQIRQVVD